MQNPERVPTNLGGSSKQNTPNTMSVHQKQLDIQIKLLLSSDLLASSSDWMALLFVLALVMDTPFLMEMAEASHSIWSLSASS